MGTDHFLLEDAIAFARSLAHREAVEDAALVVALPSLTALHYHRPQDWPWPRAFRYQHEFISMASTAETLAAIVHTQTSGAEHVINLFQPDLEPEIAEMREAGYTAAWISPILGRSLKAPWPPGRQPRPGVAIEVRTPADRRRFNSLPGISNQCDTIDSKVHCFYIEVDGYVIAKAQMIYIGGGTAYISDMYTHPDQRQQGLCSAMMASLEDKARHLGAQRCVLAPGLEPLEMGLYERYGYQRSANRAVFIPMAPPQATG